MALSGLVWTALGFLSGSIPYSWLLGRWILRRDIRTLGDGNPGATNVFRAGGRWAGVAAILLDSFKAAIPVGLACYALRLPSAWMFAVALAPLLGHMYSPFLRGRGGKAVAAAFGMWAGLTLWEMPVVLGLSLLIFYWLFDNSGWAVVLTLLGGLAYLLIFHPAALLLAIWGASFALLAWKHRQDLRQAPRLRIFLRRLKH